MSLQRLAFRLRNSLWFIPGLWAVGAGLLALGAILIDALTPSIGRDLPLVFGGGPDGARSVLSSIAASMITVASVTFSITIVALQLASSQFSPRVLRDFMRDRLSQSVLGSFIGAFFYSLLVLRSIRSADESGPEFVPAIAVTIAIGLAALAVAMLIYFIHHISTRIQVSSIVAGIADATEHAIQRDGPAGDDEDVVPVGGETPAGEPGRMPALASGARDCIVRITQVLVERGRSGEPAGRLGGSDGRLRLVERVRPFAELVSLGFDELRHYGASTPDVAAALAASLRTLRELVPSALRPPVDEQLDRLRRAADGLAPAGA